jgi:calcineurin-like phosphoesterase family protein
MSEHFIVADTHFRHHNIMKFEPEIFSQRDVFARDEMLIDRWNSTVKPKDIVWHLGDVAFNVGLPVLKRLNGKLDLLIMGNHEHKPAREYLKYFKDVKASAELMGCILTHYPVHPSQFGRYIANIHGHTHSRSLPDPRYVCVSIEQTGLKPINVTEIETRIVTIMENTQTER